MRKITYVDCSCLPVAGVGRVYGNRRRMLSSACCSRRCSSVRSLAQSPSRAFTRRATSWIRARYPCHQASVSTRDSPGECCRSSLQQDTSTSTVVSRRHTSTYEWRTLAGTHGLHDVIMLQIKLGSYLRGQFGSGQGPSDAAW